MKLYHREISPQLFESFYICKEISDFIARAQSMLCMTKHATLKRKSYLWLKNGGVVKDGKVYQLSYEDVENMKSEKFFSDIMQKVDVKDVFEIEMCDDNLVLNKIVLRLQLPNSPKTDIILAVVGSQPTLKTWYFNHSGDNHRTLKTELYVT